MITDISRTLWTLNRDYIASVLLFKSVFLKRRNKIGKEKERSEDLLLNILPYEVNKEIKEEDNAKPS